MASSYGSFQLIAMPGTWLPISQAKFIHSIEAR